MAQSLRNMGIRKKKLDPFLEYDTSTVLNAVKINESTTTGRIILRSN